jgi:hypothetical protein
VLETIDYLVRLSYPTVLEHAILSTKNHSIQQVFAKDYALLSIDEQLLSLYELHKPLIKQVFDKDYAVLSTDQQ